MYFIAHSSREVVIPDVRRSGGLELVARHWSEHLRYRVRGHVRRPGPWTWLGTRSPSPARQDLAGSARREQTANLEPTTPARPLPLPVHLRLDDVLDGPCLPTGSPDLSRDQVPWEVRRGLRSSRA